MSKIVVLGSSNIDIVAKMKSLPLPGETVGNARLKEANGGKGANQAVAAARLGGDVTFLTCLGDDLNGHKLKMNFSTDGIDTQYIKFSQDSPTGTALIFVAETGENSIAVIPGANSDFRPEDVEKLTGPIKRAEYLLLQQEIPSETVSAAIELASEAGVKVVLNPAPMRPVSDEVLSKIYLITPNETEAAKIVDRPVETEDDAKEAAKLLKAKGVKNVIITLGSKGSLICGSGEALIVPARTVSAVDTTAAGDVYNGALVTALSENKSLEEAARFATICSSISVTRLGAQPSIPYRKEVDELITNTTNN